jgi:Rrf2 family protein
MSKIFSLSEAATIAIHGMVLIARAESSGEQMNVVKITEATEASRHHVAKVMQRLVKDDLLRSNRGPHGGFVLKRTASEISLREIYESIEGKIEIGECPMDNPICPFGKCIMGNTIKTMTINFRDFLDSQKLDNYL